MELAGACPAGQVGTRPNCTTPPRPMCSAGQVGTYPDCMEPEPEPDPELGTPKLQNPVFMETYAPRAALYEALPEFLLGLHVPAHGGPSLRSRKAAIWIELSGSAGKRRPRHSTVDTDTDTEHFTAHAGATVLERTHWNMNASAHHVSGSADVSSPVKGGDIHARGKGPVAGCTLGW